MAEQDQVPQEAIPPKVTPFSKPEGGAPVTPVVPGAPRPITVRLKPVAPAVGIPTTSANPRATARVPVPESVDASPVAPAAPATVRLRPVASVPAPGSTQSIAQMNPPPAPMIPPMQPQHPPVPGSNPLPGGPKPLSGAQAHAAKSKTSRISLDSAIGVAPMTPMGADRSEPKTIRLKRPTDLAAQTSNPPTAPIRQTSRIPNDILPSQGADSSSVTQKKTLKIKRPGMKEEGAAGQEEAFAEGVQMTPINPLDYQVQEVWPGFTRFAVGFAAITVIVMLLLTLCLGAHAIGPVAGKNALAFIQGGELPWPGRIPTN